jgi:hypothetical protein
VSSGFANELSLPLLTVALEDHRGGGQAAVPRPIQRSRTHPVRHDRDHVATKVASIEQCLQIGA